VLASSTVTKVGVKIRPGVDTCTQPLGSFVLPSCIAQQNPPGLTSGGPHKMRFARRKNLRRLSRMWKLCSPRGTLRLRRWRTSEPGWLRCSRQPASRLPRALTSQQHQKPRPRTLPCRRAARVQCEVSYCRDCTVLIDDYAGSNLVPKSLPLKMCHIVAAIIRLVPDGSSCRVRRRSSCSWSSTTCARSAGTWSSAPSRQAFTAIQPVLPPWRGLTGGP